MVTVFTPTYNRAYILNDLYQSLCRQTCRKFEWLIVDDGSTDNTEGLVASWLDEGKMSLRYIKQPNGGKHRAINKGIQEANGDLFFIVDSDDYLAKNAIERILFFLWTYQRQSSVCWCIRSSCISFGRTYWWRVII
ncbi:glycosyltransferase family A protein [Bacteroides thetaiotaomicron]|jgi:hypothetical protein|uniref:glycosyltransferase family A protein n=1 Tax=Bacteroides thetaiotaomicron TaxID=818 RepID=UPI0039C40D66